MSLPHKSHPISLNERLEELKKNSQLNAINYSGVSMNDPMGNGRMKDNATLISNAWRQNFARYGKDLNLFFGRLKG